MAAAAAAAAAVVVAVVAGEGPGSYLRVSSDKLERVISAAKHRPIGMAISRCEKYSDHIRLPLPSSTPADPADPADPAAVLVLSEPLSGPPVGSAASPLGTRARTGWGVRVRNAVGSVRESSHPRHAPFSEPACQRVKARSTTLMSHSRASKVSTTVMG